MRVGHAAGQLQIAPGTPMGGYVARQGGAEGTLDPLELHAITIADGRSRFGLLVCDLLAINDDLVGALREVAPDLWVDLVWVSATHTHAGPEVGYQPGGGGVTPTELLHRLVSGCVDLLQRAVADERPGAASLHRVRTHGVGGVRADPAGAQVVPVDLLAIRGERGQLEGVVVSLPVHPTVLPATSRQISPDLHGAVRTVLSRRLAGTRDRAPWVVLTTGAAGDISTRHVRQGRHRAECFRLAEIVGDAATAGLREPGSLLWGPGDERADGLSWQVRRLRLPPAPPVPDLAVRLGDSIADRPCIDPRSLEVLLEGAGVATGRGTDDVPRDATIEIVRLGHLCLVAIPGELFLGLGETVTAEASTPAVVLGYSNGYLGYFPDDAAYDSLSYEVLASPVARGSGERIVAAGLAGIDGLRT